MRSLAILALMMITPTDVPAALAVDAQCLDHADTHLLVRRDVMETLDKAHTKLGICEPALAVAQDDLGRLQSHITAVEGVVDAHVRQRELLQQHITGLESLITRQNDYIRTLEESRAGMLAEGWESVDGMVGLGSGYVLGTATCVGMAWVFNQPQFGGNAP